MLHVHLRTLLHQFCLTALKLFTSLHTALGKAYSTTPQPKNTLSEDATLNPLHSIAHTRCSRINGSLTKGIQQPTFTSHFLTQHLKGPITTLGSGMEVGGGSIQTSSLASKYVADALKRAIEEGAGDDYIRSYVAGEGSIMSG
ncbi:hypothetical protein DSO57_1022622 [Entomophthora muscae]|uniref:Uncharacterized protein n=1 Tax=Entomophthora muscae TaxID=34485 RepID=A0ACC2RUG3_9FUNG|nr:hypothetical protein DSO57_1022622 [Entomophthora muscae]